MRRLLALSAFFAAAVAAQERPTDYPFSASLTPEGSASHYRFALPAAAYRGAARRDLGDLRVFNGAGEPVPYAFAAREAQPPAAPVRVLRLFPLYGDEEGTLENSTSTMRIRRSTDGTIISVTVGPAAAPGRRRVLGYLLDASEVKRPQEALILSWQATDGFSGQAHVEGSEDFKSWRTLAAGAPILLLKHQGETLERNRVELSGARAKYLRVSFSGVPRGFALKEIRTELRAERPELAREWLSLDGAGGKTPAELQFDSTGHFPVDRLRLVLPQSNTIAQVQFYSRERPDDPWHFVSSAVAYRLSREGGELTSPDVALPADNDRFWLVRVDQKGGGFGSGVVKLSLGWLPHEIVFAARGEAPFSLGYGNKDAKPGALPASSVLPRQGEDDAPKALPAKVGEVTDSSRPPPSLFADPGRFLGGLAENRETKKWMLWGALVAGVLVLAWMAMKLLRDVGKSGRG